MLVATDLPYCQHVLDGQLMLLMSGLHALPGNAFELREPSGHYPPQFHWLYKSHHGIGVRRSRSLHICQHGRRIVRVPVIVGMGPRRRLVSASKSCIFIVSIFNIDSYSQGYRNTLAMSTQSDAYQSALSLSS